MRTDNFKAWFRDWEHNPKASSQVVDANGEPMVVYHDTVAGGFSLFNAEGRDKIEVTSALFHSNKKAALPYGSYGKGKGQIYEVFLNPYIMDTHGLAWYELGQLTGGVYPQTYDIIGAVWDSELEPENYDFIGGVIFRNIRDNLIDDGTISDVFSAGAAKYQVSDKE